MVAPCVRLVVGADSSWVTIQLALTVSRCYDAIVMLQLTQRVGSDMLFIPFHDRVNRLTLSLKWQMP